MSKQTQLAIESEVMIDTVYNDTTTAIVNRKFSPRVKNFFRSYWIPIILIVTIILFLVAICISKNLIPAEELPGPLVSEEIAASPIPEQFEVTVTETTIPVISTTVTETTIPTVISTTTTTVPTTVTETTNNPQPKHRFLIDRLKKLNITPQPVLLSVNSPGKNSEISDEMLQEKYLECISGAPGLSSPISKEQLREEYSKCILALLQQSSLRSSAIKNCNQCSDLFEKLIDRGLQPQKENQENSPSTVFNNDINPPPFFV